MDIRKVADNINILGDFCGRRDMETLTRSALEEKYGWSQADLLILFGGSILCGCDVAAMAAKQGIARHYMIVGGEGHTTDCLRQKIKLVCPHMETEGKKEADIMAEYIRIKHGISHFLLERESTNCGNNVTNALDKLRENKVEAKSIILIQDAAMQLRMEAGFLKHMGEEGMTYIHYAAYRAVVTVENGVLEFEEPDIPGMWGMEQYITLLMGEIPRLTDNDLGYGPKGKNYIAHVEIPESVKEAFLYLKSEYGELIRQANPRYRSKEENNGNSGKNMIDKM